jgi:hypothetical protein
MACSAHLRSLLYAYQLHTRLRKRPFFQQAGHSYRKSSLGVEQPVPRISVHLAPLRQVFRHPPLYWPSSGNTIRLIGSRAGEKRGVAQ